MAFASGTTISAIANGINSVKDSTGVSATINNASSISINSTTFGSDAFVQIKTLSGTFLQDANYTSGAAAIRDDGVDTGVLVNGQIADSSGLRVDIRTGSLDGQFYLTSAFAQDTTSETTFYVTGGGVNLPAWTKRGSAGTGEYWA